MGVILHVIRQLIFSSIVEEPVVSLHYNICKMNYYMYYVCCNIETSKFWKLLVYFLFLIRQIHAYF